MGPVLREWGQWCFHISAPSGPGLSLWMWDHAGNPISFQVTLQGRVEAACAFPVLIRIGPGTGPSWAYVICLSNSPSFGKAVSMINVIWVLPTRYTNVGMWLRSGQSDYFIPTPIMIYPEIGMCTSWTNSSIESLLLAFTECLPCARNCSKCFRCIMSFNPHINSIR